MQKLGLRKLILSMLGLLCVLSMKAQGNLSISGTVIDNFGEPVVGGSVIVQGTTKGTFTDENGAYEIQAAADATLVFSFVGLSTAEEPVNNRQVINVTLRVETNELDAVVAIGYGSQKKKEVTGAVTSVKAEDFNAGVKNNPVALLQGKVAGLNISRTAGGDPTNTGYNIQIRGFSTLDKGAGTKPLYIVDGIPVDNIDNIAPDEIEAMDVLKDGSAAAIYGTRGTNGVIIITTKRGASNAAVECGDKFVEYSGYVSLSTRTGNTGMASTGEFRDLESISNGKVKPVIYADPDGRNDYETDWMKEITRSAAITHSHNVALSGATKDFSYRGSVSYKNSEGIAKNSNREEIIGKIAANQKALDGWLDIQYDISYMRYRNDFFTGSFKQAAIVNPTYPVYDERTNSGYFMPQGTGQTNPVEDMNQKESYQDGNYLRASVRPTINIKPISGLKLTAFGALEEGDNYSYWYNKLLNTNEQDSKKAGRGSSKNMNKLFEVTADYVKQLGDHKIAAVAGFSYQNFLYDGAEISNKGFPTDNAKYYQIGNGDATKQSLNVSSYRNSNTLAALFARLNYSYDEKYLLSASLRREGSSRFGANNKWGLFPAVSAGWRISREDFMKEVDWVNELKVRFGFGITGNNLASDLQSIAMLSNGGTFWYNNQWIYTYTVARNVNPDLRWERKIEYNVGVDFSFLDSRLYGTIDAYLRQTKDLLWDYKVPTPPYQYETLLANAGEMESKGLELSISAVPVRTKNWQWTTTPTIAFNDNKITKLSDPSKGFNYTETTSGGVGENGIMNTNTQILVEGQSVGAFWGYKFFRIEQDGRWMFKTPAGGYTSTPTEKDRQVIGNAQPLFTFGWNNVVTYKNFDFSMFIRGMVGNDILNITRWAYGPSESQSMNVFMEDAKKGVYTNK
ncbi:MAG: SusC/RagA family TonB-linked outer membrane protein, partial [Prevotellaceae bacterium]|nr:SusC/RagA family TonB-linked outer membrane protein [Prevotellaceae bacterium]